MTASPRSGPALLIAACILTVTGTVLSVGNSTVGTAARDHTRAHGHQARPGGDRPSPATSTSTPRATPRPPRPRSSAPPRTSTHPTLKPLAPVMRQRANRQWLLRLVAPLHIKAVRG